MRLSLDGVCHLCRGHITCLRSGPVGRGIKLFPTVIRHEVVGFHVLHQGSEALVDWRPVQDSGIRPDIRARHRALEALDHTLDAHLLPAHPCEYRERLIRVLASLGQCVGVFIEEGAALVTLANSRSQDELNVDGLELLR